MSLFASCLFPILNNIRCKLPQQICITPDGRQMEVVEASQDPALCSLKFTFSPHVAFTSQQIQLLQICLNKWISVPRRSFATQNSFLKQKWTLIFDDSNGPVFKCVH